MNTSAFYYNDACLGGGASTDRNIHHLPSYLQKYIFKFGQQFLIKGICKDIDKLLELFAVQKIQHWYRHNRFSSFSPIKFCYHTGTYEFDWDMEFRINNYKLQAILSDNKDVKKNK